MFEASINIDYAHGFGAKIVNNHQVAIYTLQLLSPDVSDIFINKNTNSDFQIVWFKFENIAREGHLVSNIITI